MKRNCLTAICLAVVILLGGCGQKGGAEASGEEQPSSGASTSLEDVGLGENPVSDAPVPGSSDQWSRFPVEPRKSIEVPETYLPVQLVHDEPVAYQLANRIMEMQYFGAPQLTPFDGIENAMQMELLKIALYHTPEIRLNMTENEQGEIVTQHWDHPLVALMKRESAEGRDLTHLYYLEDVQETLTDLYGDALDDVWHNDQYPYYYYKVEGVYGQRGDFGGPMFAYPIVMDYTETDEAFVVEVAMVFALDRQTPMELEDGTVLTAENARQQLTEKVDVVRYTLKKAEGGRLLLDGFAIVSQAQH